MNAVFGHLGRVCGMFGNGNEQETSDCEQLLCEIYDLRNVMTGYAYGSGPGGAEDILKAGKKHFYKLNQWLTIQAENNNNNNDGKDVVHLVNGKYSAPDFHLYEMVDQFEALAKANDLDLYKDDKNMNMIQQFKVGFETLPENQFYLSSWLHTELPFNNCMAKFGSLPGPKNYVYGESEKDGSCTFRGKGVVTL